MQPYKYEVVNTAAVNFGTGAVISPPEAAINSFAPFNHLFFQNKSAATITLRLDGSIDGSNAIQGSGRTFFIKANDFIEIEVDDGILFKWIAILNTSAAANIAIGDLTTSISNF